jgi:hypothetical protein
MNLEYKNFPSKYELLHITWKGIEFDREQLIKFIKRIKLLKFLSIFSKQHKEELIILNEIYNLYDKRRINGLLNNESNISKWAIIEKWSRIAAVDLLLTGTYSRNTFTTISNFPVQDYQLTIKRIEELVDTGKNLTYQKDKISDNIPGL